MTMTAAQKAAPKAAPKSKVDLSLALQVFELAAAGANVMQIADKLSVSLARVVPALEEGKRLVRESTPQMTAEVQSLEIARIDRMRMALWGRCMKGEDVAIRTYLLLMDQRAKYTAGLYVDQKVRLDFEDAMGRKVGSVAMSDGRALLKRLEALSASTITRDSILHELQAAPADDDDEPEQAEDSDNDDGLDDIGAEIIEMGSIT